MSHMKRCPACDFPIYDRAKIHCDHCGEVIPEELRFTGDDLRRIQELKQADEERIARNRAKRLRDLREQRGGDYPDIGSL